MSRSKLTLAVVVAIALAALAAPAMAQGQNEASIYLPFAITRRAGPPPTPGPGSIYGRVTIAGQPANGVTVTLRAMDEATIELVAEATVIRGNYLFSGPPPLPSGKIYYVFFGPNTWDASLVNSWYGPEIPTYVAGEDVLGGNFDLENIELIAPGVDESVTSPTTFTWVARSVSDTYRVEIFDAETGSSWQTPDLGHVEQVLIDMPVDAEFGREYGWIVWSYLGPTSFGQSFFYNPFTFRESEALTRPPREARRPALSRQRERAR